MLNPAELVRAAKEGSKESKDIKVDEDDDGGGRGKVTSWTPGVLEEISKRQSSHLARMTCPRAVLRSCLAEGEVREEGVVVTRGQGRLGTGEVERARALLAVEQGHLGLEGVDSLQEAYSTLLASCPLDQYRVYSCLSGLGYRLVRSKEAGGGGGRGRPGCSRVGVTEDEDIDTGLLMPMHGTYLDSAYFWVKEMLEEVVEGVVKGEGQGSAKRIKLDDEFGCEVEALKKEQGNIFINPFHRNNGREEFKESVEILEDEVSDVMRMEKFKDNCIEVVDLEDEEAEVVKEEGSSRDEAHRVARAALANLASLEVTRSDTQGRGGLGVRGRGGQTSRGRGGQEWRPSVPGQEEFHCQVSLSPWLPLLPRFVV